MATVSHGHWDSGLRGVRSGEPGMSTMVACSRLPRQPTKASEHYLTSIPLSAQRTLGSSTVSSVTSRRTGEAPR